MKNSMNLRWPFCGFGETCSEDAIRLFHLLEALADILDDGLVVHDQQRRIYLFNRAAERITGLKREEALGRNCHEVFPPDGICGSRCQLAGGEEPDHYEMVFTDRSGTERRLRITRRWIDLGVEGGPAVMAVLRDVTEVSQLRLQVKERYSFQGMVGRSEAMREVFQTIRQVTTSDYPVLITGESGTGKELAARAIHHESRRQGGPFVPINCGALPENILESELFGHVRGAFTGAIRDKKGRFELADGGTLFLDEVGELSQAFQVKLLRVLQEMRFERVGGEKPIQVDVRVIAATNRELKQLLASSTFRQDLYYRLAVVPIHLPPLRERREDLPYLIDQVLERIRHENPPGPAGLTDEALERLLAHSWPGNVRELINSLQVASVRSGSGRIELAHLPPEVRQGTARPTLAGAALPTGRRRRLERSAVEEALQRTGGNRVQAARLLGVGRATLYRFLGKHGLL